MLESHVENRVSRHAKRRGWLCFKWSSPGQRGVPDRIYFKADEVKLIEFKAPGKIATKQQIEIHRKLRKQGFEVHVIDDIEKGKQLFP